MAAFSLLGSQAGPHYPPSLDSALWSASKHGDADRVRHLIASAADDSDTDGVRGASYATVAPLAASLRRCGMLVPLNALTR